MTQPPHCEPPAEMQEFVFPKVQVGHGGRIYVQLRHGDSERGADDGYWRILRDRLTAALGDGAEASGPVHSAAEVAALVRAGRAARDWQRQRVMGNIQSNSTVDETLLRKLDAALSAPSFRSIPDDTKAPPHAR